MNKMNAVWLAALFAFVGIGVVGAAPWIVEEGRPRAEILIAEDPPRFARLAAEELQAYIEKMSGARLPISATPSGDYPVAIHVGRSARTDALGVTDEGLKHGAFRIASGENWLVLLGHDFDFEPPVPAIYGRGASDRLRAEAEWDKMTQGRTDSAWRNPHASLHRSFHSETGTWHHDQGGSLNAVCELLRTLGVRWYFPGELGEVVPRMDSIALPKLAKTSVPDFPVRRFFGPAYFVMSRDDLMWMRRLGLNHGYPVLAAGAHVHGLRGIHGRAEMQEAHPEYYALIGGQRHVHGAGHVCFSSEAFVREAANYARAMFDLLDEPVVDLWPNDGLRMCECDQCLNLSPSEAVFGFLDRVAREVYKTHPDRMITSGAYSSYRQPPPNIEKFGPNVGITVAFHRPGLDQPETWSHGGMAYDELIGGWMDRVVSGHVLGNSNHRGATLMPRSIVKDLRSRRGRSVGDWNEVGHVRGDDLRGGRETGRQTWRLGIHHLNMYINARFLWETEQDLDGMLDEYYRLFYGPAAAEVKEAFEFAEASYLRGQGSARLTLEDRIELTEKLHAAREAAGDTVYGKRIAYVLEEETSLEDLRKAQENAERVAEQRTRAPLILARDRVGDAPLREYSLVDLTTGEAPDVETAFRIEWDDGTLIFDIRCSEPDMENLYITQDVWSGDSVGFMVETPFHTYYQIEINPDGKVADIDREHGQINLNWNSLAEVATERGADYWRIVARFPIMDEAAGVLDPQHNIVGEKPTLDAPWFVQIGRVRIRDFQKTAYGFTSAGGTYHNRQRFGRLAIEQ